MYEIDTILELKEQRDPDEETGEEFPYNRVRVVGPSPINHGVKSKWEGPDAAGVVIVPLTNFGATLDEPFGKLRALYNVAEMPEDDVPVTAPRVDVRTLPKVKLGPTPEQVFAEQAPGVPPKEGETRARTPLTLDGPDGPPSNDPLGDD